MASNRGRAGKQYTQRAAELKASGRPCCHCGRPIDPTLKAPHPRSHSVEHTVIPVADMPAGSPLMWAEWNTDSACRSCNVADGNARRRGTKRSAARRTSSRTW